jgi:DNA replication protein DnaC
MNDNNIVQKITRLASSGQAGILLTSYEPLAAHQQLMDWANRNASTGTAMFSWDEALFVTQGGFSLSPQVFANQLGLEHDDSFGNMMPLELFLGNILDVCQKEVMSIGAPSDRGTFVFCVKNADRYLSLGHDQVNTAVLALCQQIAALGQAAGVILILIASPKFTLPSELTALFEVVEHTLPSSDLLRSAVLSNLEDVDEIPQDVLAALAGLPLAKAVQYCAESLASQGRLDPNYIFYNKAYYLKNTGLGIWDSRVSNFPCRPLGKKWENAKAVEVTSQKTHLDDSTIPNGEIVANLRYLLDGKYVEESVGPITVKEFDTKFRPDRDRYKLDSVVGLDYLKKFFKNSLRPNIPDRAKPKHFMMVGLPGVGKTMISRCLAGEMQSPLSFISAANMLSKYYGESEKKLAQMLEAVSMIGGLLFIDELEKFLPKSGGDSDAGSADSHLLGQILEWLNDQTTNLVLSTSNDIRHIPDAVTRSERTDLIVFLGFPGEAAKTAAWKMYMDFHELKDQEIPAAKFWTPADIKSCCRQAEQQAVPLMEAAEWVTPSYEKNPEQLESLMSWAERVGCIDAETGKKFKRSSEKPARVSSGRQVRKGLSE